MVRCDLYYVLIGDNGRLNNGTLLQIGQKPGDRQHYSLSEARFSMSGDDLTVHWKARKGRKYGSLERATLENFNRRTGRFDYRIYEHDDRSQIGESQSCRKVDFSRLPNYVQNAVRPYLRAKMSPQERIRENAKWLNVIKEYEKLIDEL